MDPKSYSEIEKYLRDGKVPKDRTTKSASNKFANQCKRYLIDEGQLYRWTRKGGKSLVIQRHQVEPLLYLLHDDPTGAHFGTSIMLAKLRQKYTWPGMAADVETYVKTCYQCQRRKRPETHNEMHGITAEAPFERIGIDFVGPLPETEEGNRYILVMVDYFTKWPEVRATKRADAKTVVKFLYEEVICRHGPPVHIHSDRGTHFVNQLVEGLSEKFRMRHHRSTPYRPQANGQVERFNRTLCEALAKQTEGVEDWDEYIQPTLFAYRIAPLRATGMTPFFLIYGREPRWPPYEKSEPIALRAHIDKLIHEVPQQRHKAAQVIKKGKQMMEDRYKPKAPCQFKCGDQVWMYDKSKESSYSGKLLPKRKGPFEIEKVLRNGTYILGNAQGVIKTPINGDLLELAKSRSDWEPIVVIPTGEYKEEDLD
jgi:Integrase zinc binding domain/Integrase core domain